MRFSIFKITQLLVLFFLSNASYAQLKKNITLEDAYEKLLFSESIIRGVNWMNDGQYYTAIESISGADNIIQYDIASGERVKTILDGTKLNGLRFSDYSFSADETKILLETESEKIYRRSSKANYYIYDLKNQELTKLESKGKQSYATFSPDGLKVAYVLDNDLYYIKLSDMTSKRISNDGKRNHIINGSSDWVYEEEFSFAKAFFWSPNSQNIAYYRFDESKVPEYNMQIWGELYPKDYRFKYPKAGEPNSSVQIKVFSIQNNKSIAMEIESEKDIYIPRLYWTGIGNTLSVIRMNRLQNKLEILHSDITNGKTQSILTEISGTYVDINYTDDITYLDNGKSFFRTSEKSGYKHIYQFSSTGKEIRQITKGEWDVDQFLGIDSKNKLIYYISSESTPLERELFSIKLNGKNKTKLSTLKGTNEVELSPDFKYYINTHSSVDSPTQISLHQAPSGHRIKTLEDNSYLKSVLSNYNISKTDFFSFKTSEGVELNASRIKPSDFDSNKKYPVLLFVYGGPGSQKVRNSWANNYFYFHQYLTQLGYIIITVDTRGTGARGKEFKHRTYENLGKYEVIDLIETAKYLKGLPYIDGSRIGIWGWSYGGYLSSLTLFKGADYFKMAISVAPVTNWRYYDTIYSERFLKRPEENPNGYDNNSPVQHAEKLEGNFLLIHGTADDNVHVQNSFDLQDALISANKQFDSFYYPNRNHGIYGGNTRLHLYKMMANYIANKL